MNIIKIIHTVNVLNYLFLIIGGLICVLLTLALGDLLIYFELTSLAAGIFSGWHLNADDAKLRKVGFVWFIVNMFNMFVMVPLLIFVIFLGISF